MKWQHLALWFAAITFALLASLSLWLRLWAAGIGLTSLANVLTMFAIAADDEDDTLDDEEYQP